MTSYRGQQAMGEMVAAAALRKSIEPFLQAGEELLAVVGVRRMGLVSKWTWSCLEVSPASVELAKRMAVVVTSGRVLILVTGGGLINEAKSVLVEVPVAEVRSVELRGGAVVSEVSWSARGVQYTVSADRGRATQLARALGHTPSAPSE